MNEAPARISMIIVVSRIAPIALAQNELQVRLLAHQAMASEPTTPHAAHSVAVAQPKSRLAVISRISSEQGIRFADSRSFMANDIGGSRGGVFSGRSSDQTTM